MRRFAAIAAGFSLLYAVCVSFFYPVWLQGMEDGLTALFDNTLNPAMFVASVVLSLVVGRSSAFPRRPLVIVGYLLLALGLASTLVAAIFGDGLWVGASGVCAGAGMGLVVPFYFEAIAGFSRIDVARACGLMSLLGMLLVMPLELVPAYANVPIYMVFLGVSACCLRLAPLVCQEDSDSTPLSSQRCAPTVSQQAGSSVSARDRLDAFLVPVVCTLALSVVYGVMDTFVLGKGSAPQASLVVSQFGGVAAALVFIAVFGRREGVSSPSSLFNTVFGLLATGLLLLPFLPETYALTLNAFVAAGWKLVMLALFYLVITRFAGHRQLLLAGIAFAYALPRLGLWVGIFVARWLGVEGTADFMKVVAVAFCLLYLVLMVIWVANSHERRVAERRALLSGLTQGEAPRGPWDAWERRCADIAAARGLTEREAEILLMVARGRDTASICEALSLSHNTVMSYRKSIYAKLGVHSRQDVIDLFSPQDQQP